MGLPVFDERGPVTHDYPYPGPSFTGITRFVSSPRVGEWRVGEARYWIDGRRVTKQVLDRWVQNQR